MDQTLALNFCPFRSPSWDLLVGRNESIEFSKRLSTPVFEIVEPSVIVCVGRPPMENLELVLQDRGAALTDRVVRPIYWGDGHGGSYTHEVARYTTTRGKVTMVYIPHLSRFGIFGRRKSLVATTRSRSPCRDRRPRRDGRQHRLCCRGQSDAQAASSSSPGASTVGGQRLGLRSLNGGALCRVLGVRRGGRLRLVRPLIACARRFRPGAPFGSLLVFGSRLGEAGGDRLQRVEGVG